MSNTTKIIFCIILSLVVASCSINANIKSLNAVVPESNSQSTPKLSIDLNQLTLAEGSGIELKVTIDPVSDKDTIVDLNLSTSSSSFVRFNPIPTQITIPSGESSKQVIIDTIDDSLLQDQESWQFSIQSGDSVVSADRGTLKITLNDNDGGDIPDAPQGAPIAKPLREFNSYPAVIKKAAFNGKAFFVGSDATHGAELWVSDGTPLGTRLVKDIESGPSSSNISDFWIAGSYTYFIATTISEGTELWQTDGTTAGTRLVYGAESGAVSSTPTILLSYNNKLYFSLQTAANGREIYATDGTQAGTQMLFESFAGAAGSSYHGAILSGSDVYFSQRAFDSTLGNIDGFYKTNGTSAGTTLMASKFDDGSSLEEINALFFAHNGQIYFESLYYANAYVATELFVTNGTDASTYLLKNFYTPGSSYARPTGHILNGKVVLYVQRDDIDSTAMGYYLTDGTKVGTLKVAQPVRTASSTAVLGVINNKLIYAACVGTYDCELYSSAGVANDAVLLKDINPGSTSGNANSSSPTFVAQFGNRIIFTATNLTEGKELWVTDGTPSGTVILKDILLGSASSSPAEFTVNGSYLIFSARSNATGDELWITDGTTSGTLLFKDLIPGVVGSGAKNLALMDSSQLFFTAYNTQSRFASGFVMNLTNLSVSSLSHAMVESLNSETKNIIEHNGLVYFDAMDSNGGNPLWSTDGTQTGTNKIVDLYPNIVTSDINNLTSLNGKLTFNASTEISGNEFHSSDGTSAGTAVLKEIGLGSISGAIFTWGKAITDMGIRFFSAGGDATVGSELYMTDGTVSGTQLVRDIDPGVNHSNPERINAFQGLNKVIFVTFNSLASLKYSLRVSDGTSAGTVAVLSGVYGIWNIFIVPGGAIVVYSNANAPDVRIIFVNKTTNSVTQVGTNNNISGGSHYMMNTDSNVMYYTTYSSGPQQHNLWKTDGTVGGTVMVKTIASVTSPTSTTFNLIQNLGNKTIFAYRNTAPTPDVNQLWVTDGTSGGTTVIDTGEDTTLSVYTSGFVYNNLIYFSKYTSALGSELWRTDGTLAGTQMVKDINVGANSSAVTFLTIHNSRLYFSANDGEHGAELWRTDGTSQGTQLVHDINPGAPSSTPGFAKSLASKLYFQATKVLSGKEVWVYAD